MLKVVSVSDKVGTAIDRLCKGVAKYHQNLDYFVCDVHPKRPEQTQLDRFVELALDADIIDFQYFRTAQMLLERYEWLKDKKLILTHNNPYSIYESDWQEFDHLVANNQTMLQNLKDHTRRDVTHIPLTVDTDFWKFNRDWTPNNNVIMVANRIEDKKGILEVATAVGNLGMKLILVGAISKRPYFEEIMQTGSVDFYEQISDDQLRELYYNSTIHICNSKDNFESGTLPILEAMLCGVPVLTRNVGHVPDLYNGDNLRVMESQPEEVEKIMDAITEMLSDKKALETQRQSAWNTAKNFDNERRAYLYQKLYRSVLSPYTPVSVIVPIYDKPEVIRACLNAIAEQDYPNMELIVVDDGDTTDCELFVKEFVKTVNFPVRYIQTTRYNDIDGEYDIKDYGLARARNEGAIYATGELLIFCDQRQIMEQGAITNFVDNHIPKSWLYGNKGSRKDFVENFSCISKQDFMDFGGFNERMDCYGGLSQETRSRAKRQGFHLNYIETAKATPMGKSSNKYTKRDEIIRSKNRLFMMGLQ